MKKKCYYFFLLLIGFQFSALATEPFRFVLLSDLHISNTNPQPSLDLANAVADVNKLSGIDFVIVAGDIANLGDTVSLRLAKQMLQRLYIPFFVIPGNHDVKWYENGTTNFKAIFGENKFEFRHKGIEFIGFTTAPLTNSGLGTIQQDDILWMKKILEKTDPKMPVIVITHYPLQTGDVDNWKEMIVVLNKYNVHAVLGGHVHRNVLFNYEGIPGIISRSTLRGKDPVGGYSIFSISDSIRVYEKKSGKPEEKWLTLPFEYKNQLNTNAVNDYSLKKNKSFE